MSAKHRLAIGSILAALLAGCGSKEETHEPPPAVHLNEEAGFSEIESVHISIADPSYPSDITTPPARLFYAFQPADEAPQDKPLFVFFNGGPGFATTLGLFADNTARRSLDKRNNGGAAVGPSPRSWTTMGNLLYIDPRQCGFSYDVGDPGDNPSARAEAFTGAVFNPFADAADVIRVVLRFLAAHPDIQKQPVIVVGESYGGTRANAMLFEIHHPDQIDGSVASALYRDEALAAEIRAHFAAVRPGEPFTPELAASQFGKQILVEPAVAGDRQFLAAATALGSAGSPLPDIALKYGVACTTCAAGDASCDPTQASHDCIDALRAAHRDVGDLSQTDDALTAAAGDAETALRTLATLQQVIGVDPRTIPQLAAAGRAGAYRFSDQLPMPLPPPNDIDTPEPIAQDLGALPAWDRYLVGQSAPVQFAAVTSMLSWNQDLWGMVFLSNLELTDTFITSAEYDTIVYLPSLGDALLTYPEVKSAALDRTPKKGVARPGWLTVEHIPMGETAPQTHVIRMPLYAAGHAVSAGQPIELADDVAAWLAGGN
jgi:hypothetical protein